MNNKGRKLLRDMKLYSDFLGWNDELGRYETWDEAVTDVFNTHRTKYEYCMPELKPYLEYAENAYKEGKFLGSQRMLQFRGEDIFKHEFRGYNCSVVYGDKSSWLGNAFYLLLCGCGVGVNLMTPFSKRMPNLVPRNAEIKHYIVEDSIEGWADAAHVLISSYVEHDAVFPEYQGYTIKFDYSQIRERGTKVGRKFKAPGSEGLRKAIEKIEYLIDNYLKGEVKAFKSIIAYDIFMHLSDAVLSGGVRRSAASVIVSPEDTDMIYARSGDWTVSNPQRARSNNSVGLIRGKFSKEFFLELLKINQGVSDIGFVFMNNIFENFNPCFEIQFTALVFDYSNKDIVARIMESDETLLDEGLVRTAIQMCNLTEGNGAACKTEQDFYDMCRAEAITGTIQAGYTGFKHLRGEHVLEDSILVTQKEALLGVSIAGIMNNPSILLNPEILKNGAEIVLQVNKEVAAILGINATARATTIKPGGNGPVVLMCTSGATAEHSKRSFRVMQLNKDTEVAKWLEVNMSFLIEESVYSANDTDYVVFLPIENPEGTIYKNDMKGVKHLEVIKLIMNNWIKNGKNEENCIIPTTCHNVSNTVIIDDYEAMSEYIYENMDSFTAVSFISEFGDKDYNQAPNTSIYTSQELLDKYGDAVMLASGLIVDGLHAFNNNLWDACKAVTSKDYKLTGDRREVFFKKDWVSRAKKFSKNYFKGNLEETIYCLKDVHLFHKWKTINRQIKEVDFTQILSKPEFKNIDEMGAMACGGGACEIVRM